MAATAVGVRFRTIHRDEVSEIELKRIAGDGGPGPNTHVH